MPGKADSQLLNDTLLQMQQSIVDLTGHVGAIGGKIDTFIAQMAAHDVRTTDLEVRTRKVENRQHWYAGATAAIGMLFGKFAPGLFPHA